jgi:hypothetical protein
MMLSKILDVWYRNEGKVALASAVFMIVFMGMSVFNSSQTYKPTSEVIVLSYREAYPGMNDQ